MNCHVCDSGQMVAKTVSETVEFDGAPAIEIQGVRQLECDHCHDLQIDTVASRERTKKILTKLVQLYSPRISEIPGKVAHLMRHAVGLSQNELAAEVGGIDPSAFAHAAARNTHIDRYSAFVLLSLCADFVTGKSEGRKLVEETKSVDKILEQSR